MRYCLLIAALMSVAANSSGLAGVLITSTQVNLASKEAKPISGFIEGDRLKIVTPESTVIFRADLRKTWVIGTAAGTYVEITPEIVSAFAARIAAAQTPGSAEQAKLQERLAKLPPQQRELAEQQLRGLQAGAGAAQQVAYAKIGQAKMVGPWRCELYGKSISGQRQEDLCVAPVSTVGLSDSDFRVLDQFTAFMGPVATSPMAPRADYFNWADLSKAIGFSGIPLEATLLRNGQPAVQDTMQKIERVDISADEFELPSGLTKRQLTGLR